MVSLSSRYDDWLEDDPAEGEPDTGWDDEEPNMDDPDLAEIRDPYTGTDHRESDYLDP